MIQSRLRPVTAGRRMAPSTGLHCAVASAERLPRWRRSWLPRNGRSGRLADSFNLGCRFRGGLTRILMATTRAGNCTLPRQGSGER